MPDDTSHDNDVHSGPKCPKCGERDADHLVWIEDDRIDCQMCGTTYDPSERGGGDGHDTP